MARLGEKNEGMTVPKFGGWDHKAGQTNYSMVFSQARAKKQTRTDGPSFFKHNLDNEDLLTPPQAPHSLNPPPAFHASPPPSAQPYNACVFQVPLSPKVAQSHQKNNSKKGKRFMKFFTPCMCMRS